jgi:hypothetical protein
VRGLAIESAGTAKSDIAKYFEISREFILLPAVARLPLAETLDTIFMPTAGRKN